MPIATSSACPDFGSILPRSENRSNGQVYPHPRLRRPPRAPHAPPHGRRTKPTPTRHRPPRPPLLGRQGRSRRTPPRPDRIRLVLHRLQRLPHPRSRHPLRRPAPASPVVRKGGSPLKLP